jgi:multiple sugar transport system substrate-binding protein
MYDREKNLFDSYAGKRISRRDLLDGAAKLGIAGVAANAAFASAMSRAMAADFNWKAYSGKSVKLLLNKHPYVDAMIGDLEAFKTLTGMNVTYDIFPEDVYFDKVTAALSSKSDQYDAFMTGAYMTWTYGPAGWIDRPAFGAAARR